LKKSFADLERQLAQKDSESNQVRVAGILLFSIFSNALNILQKDAQIRELSESSERWHLSASRKDEDCQR
jgi:hypothetical protein